MTLGKNIVNFTVNCVMILSFGKRLLASNRIVFIFSGVDRPVNTEATRIGGWLNKALSLSLKPDPFVSFLGLAYIDVFLIDQCHDLLVAMRTDIKFGRFKTTTGL